MANSEQITLLTALPNQGVGVPISPRIYENARQYKGAVGLALAHRLQVTIANSGVADVVLTSRQVRNILASYVRPGPKSSPEMVSNPTGNDLAIGAAHLGWGAMTVLGGSIPRFVTVPALGNVVVTLRFYDPFGMHVKVDGVMDTGLAVGDMMDSVTITTMDAAALAAINAGLTFVGGVVQLRTGIVLAHPNADVHVGRPSVIQRTDGITDGSRTLPDGQHFLDYLDLVTAVAVGTSVMTDISLAGERRATNVLFDELRSEFLNGNMNVDDNDELDVANTGAPTKKIVPLMHMKTGDGVAERPTGTLSYTLAAAVPHSWVSIFSPAGAQGAPVVARIADRGHQIATAEAREIPVAYEPHVLGAGSGRHNITGKVAWRGMTRTSQTNRATNEATLLTNVAAGAEVKR